MRWKSAKETSWN